MQYASGETVRLVCSRYGHAIREADAGSGADCGVAAQASAGPHAAFGSGYQFTSDDWQSFNEVSTKAGEIQPRSGGSCEAAKMKTRFPLTCRAILIPISVLLAGPVLGSSGVQPEPVAVSREYRNGDRIELRCEDLRVSVCTLNVRVGEASDRLSIDFAEVGLMALPERIWLIPQSLDATRYDVAVSVACSEKDDSLAPDSAQQVECEVNFTVDHRAVIWGSVRVVPISSTTIYRDVQMSESR